MIPPFLATKAAELVAPLVAKFSSPLIKWGSIAGVVVAIVGYTNWKTYDHMRTQCEESKIVAIAEQAQETNRQIIQAETMESQVAQQNRAVERDIERKAEQVKREVVHHARQNQKPLSTAVVSIYDRLISVPNETVNRVPSSNPGTGSSEVPRGGLEVKPTPGIQDEDGNTIELTTEELAQAAVDFAEKYALMKNAYKGLSDWNDGREKIELERLKDD